MAAELDLEGKVRVQQPEGTQVKRPGGKPSGGEGTGLHGRGSRVQGTGLNSGSLEDCGAPSLDPGAMGVVFLNEEWEVAHLSSTVTGLCQVKWMGDSETGLTLVCS